MRNFREKILVHGSALNPLLAMAEAGISPAEIKAFVIEKLSPYFLDRSILEELAIDVLAAQAVNVSRVKADPWADSAFLHVLNVYRQAESRDSEATYRACAESEPSVAASLADYWSALYLEQPKFGLDLSELKYEVFRNLGSMIEAQLQPLLRELLIQVRITRNKGARFSEVQPLSLGKIVGELYDTAGYQELFAPSPWGIRLNQWRNMAQHHGTLVQGDKVHGYYGEPHNQCEIKLTREELWQVLHRIVSAYRAVQLARTLFFIDNLEKIRPHLPPFEMRKDAVAFSFVAAVATQGFRVEELDITEETASAVLTDVVDTTKERLVHASQLLLPLWSLTHCNFLDILYKDKTGTPKMSFRTTGEACLRLDAGEIDLKTYLTFVDFINEAAGAHGNTSRGGP
ncbi:MAG: hypothetical protein QOH06_1429 [Acidobacteriota bacterium]|jgi:hypothetical protein|nr:hypothetical protein [Acidobacteriota bacterium]